jgi:hypothetical protein
LSPARRLRLELNLSLLILETNGDNLLQLILTLSEFLVDVMTWTFLLKDLISTLYNGLLLNLLATPESLLLLTKPVLETRTITVAGRTLL